MLISELSEKLNLEYVNFAEDREICDCYIGDMLSVVMSKAPEDAAWITVQTNVNITAVSVLTGVACVIVVEGLEPDEETITKAKEQDVNILKTRKTAYQLASEINKLL